MLGLDGILRASSSRIGPRASVRSSRLTTIGLSRRFLAGSNAAADNYRIGNARSSFHGGLSRTRVRLPPPPPNALMTGLEWQSRREYSHRHTGWPAWDVLNDLATEPEPASTLEQITFWSSGFARPWCYRGHADECWLLVSSVHRKRKAITVEVEDRIHTTFPPFDACAHEHLDLIEFQGRNSALGASCREDILAMMTALWGDHNLTGL